MSKKSIILEEARIMASAIAEALELLRAASHRSNVRDAINTLENALALATVTREAM